MNTIKLSARWARTGIAVIALSAFVAACGSSSSTNSSTTKSASTGTTGRTALAACLKQHGVSFPTNRFRPGSGGPPTGASGAGGAPPGGFGASGATGRRGFAGGGGGFFRNPKFQAALKACGAHFGGGFRGGFNGRPGGAGFSHTAIDKYVACVRSHGYNLPTPNFSGKGSVFPANIRTNKKFQAASKDCVSDLRSSAPAGSSGSGSSS